MVGACCEAGIPGFIGAEDGAAVCKLGVGTRVGGDVALPMDEGASVTRGLVEGIDVEELFDASDMLPLSFWPTKTAIKTAAAATTITTKTSAPAQTKCFVLVPGLVEAVCCTLLFEADRGNKGSC